MAHRLLVTVAVVVLAAPARGDDANWPAFRGGAAAGTSDAKGLPSTWSATQNVVWRVDVPGRGRSSPVVWGDYFYNTDDHGGLFTCLEAKTGKPVCEQEKVGGFYTASLWAYEDKIFALKEYGEAAVLQAGTTFKVLAKNPLNEFTLSTPAIARKSLFIRTLTKLYRIEQPPGGK